MVPVIVSGVEIAYEDAPRVKMQLGPKKVLVDVSFTRPVIEGSNSESGRTMG